MYHNVLVTKRIIVSGRDDDQEFLSSYNPASTPHEEF
jgi:hypothetical protein